MYEILANVIKKEIQTACQITCACHIFKKNLHVNSAICHNSLWICIIGALSDATYLIKDNSTFGAHLVV